MAKGITRRDAIKKMGAVAGAAIIAPKLAGCGDDDSGGEPDGGPADAPGPDARPVGITNIVVVMQENRSYDHYLGARKLEGLPGDGLVAGMSNLDMGGTARAIYRETVHCIPDPPHGWDSSRLQFNAGLNDGFVTQYQADHQEDIPDIPPYVMGYFLREDIPITWKLADAYTSCDRWFCSVLGPTWPNRFYLHSAQSNGRKDNSVVPAGESWPTIYDRLDAAGVPWNYYYTDLPFLFTMDILRNWKSLENFFSDARAGTLPPVAMVDAGSLSNDDHPPKHPLLGQQFIASIYQALATSPQWPNTLFVVTYDEHGGFFDHVPPPTAADEREEFQQLGFRVPSLVIGPYVKQGHVSSVVYDHTSVLKQIETMFDLEPLTMRDAAANGLDDAIDQDRLAAGNPAPPIELPEVIVDPDMLDPACFGPAKPTDLELAIEQGHLDPKYDLRRYSRDTIHFIADYLQKHGLGGFRRRR